MIHDEPGTATARATKSSRRHLYFLDRFGRLMDIVIYFFFIFVARMTFQNNKYGCCWTPLSSVVGFFLPPLVVFLLVVDCIQGSAAAAAPPLSTLSSSIFRLQLGPTAHPLGSVATRKLRLSMETLLFPTISSSSTVTTTTTTTTTTLSLQHASAT